MSRISLAQSVYLIGLFQVTFVPTISYSMPASSYPGATVPVKSAYSTTTDIFGQQNWTLRSSDNDVLTELLDVTTPPDRSVYNVSVVSPRVSSYHLFQAFVGYSATTVPTMYFTYNSSIVTVRTGAIGDIIHVFKIFMIGDYPAIFYSFNTVYTVRISANIFGTDFATATDTTLGFPAYPSPAYSYMTNGLFPDIRTNLINVFPGPPSFIALVLQGLAPPNDVVRLSFWAQGQSSVSIWTGSAVSTLIGAQIIQDTINGQFMTLVFGWRDNTGLQVSYSTNFHTAATVASVVFSTPIVLDTSTIYQVNAINTNSGDSLITYSRKTISGEYQVIALTINELEFELSRPYRIRDGIPLGSGTSGTLTGDCDKEIVLPASMQSNIDIYSCQYMYLYNANTYIVPTNFSILNDFILIESYDSISNTITLSQSMSATPCTTNIPTIGDTVINLSIQNPSNIGQDFSGNGYNFTPGSTTQYVSSVTDSNNFTLTDVCDANSTAPVWGTATSLTYSATQTELTNLYIGVPTFTLTLAIWVYYKTFTYPSAQQYAALLGPFSNQFIGVYWDTVSSTLKAGIGLASSTTLTIPGVQTGQWYYVVYTTGTGYPTVAYLNGQAVASSDTVAYQEPPTTTLTVGSSFNGYFKGFVLSSSYWSQQQVSNAYASYVDPSYYSIGWEIWGECYDNWTPLNYTGQSLLTSQNQCYEVELTNLTLPNVVLSTGFGNRIAFYPYVYVEFSQINDIVNNPFYSNNPAVTRVLFKVPITNTAAPSQALFVTNFSNMRQIVKFKPNSNFHFAVYLYNGELFETAIIDTIPPLPPNYLLQISATLGFKRVSNAINK